MDTLNAADKLILLSELYKTLTETKPNKKDKVTHDLITESVYLHLNYIRKVMSR